MPLRIGELLDDELFESLFPLDDSVDVEVGDYIASAISRLSLCTDSPSALITGISAQDGVATFTVSNSDGDIVATIVGDSNSDSDYTDVVCYTPAGVPAGKCRFVTAYLRELIAYIGIGQHVYDSELPLCSKVIKKMATGVVRSVTVNATPMSGSVAFIGGVGCKLSASALNVTIQFTGDPLVRLMSAYLTDGRVPPILRPIKMINDVSVDASQTWGDANDIKIEPYAGLVADPIVTVKSENNEIKIDLKGFSS